MESRTAGVRRTDDGAYSLASGIRRSLPAGIRRFQCRTGRSGSPSICGANHRVPAGDRLRRDGTSSDAPRFDPHPRTTRPWGRPLTRCARPSRRASRTGSRERTDGDASRASFRGGWPEWWRVRYSDIRCIRAWATTQEAAEPGLSSDLESEANGRLACGDPRRGRRDEWGRGRPGRKTTAQIRRPTGRAG